VESYQQLFALTKNPKYVKMRLPKNGAAIRIEQYCKRRKDRKRPKRQEDSSCVFAYYFVAALAIAAIPQEKKTRRNHFGAGQEKEALQKPLRWHGTTAIKGEASSRPCMPQSECGTGHTGYRAFPDPSPGGSQDTGGAFRSRVQRPGVRHRSIGAGHIAPCGSVLTWHK